MKIRFILISLFTFANVAFSTSIEDYIFRNLGAFDSEELIELTTSEGRFVAVNVRSFDGSYDTVILNEKNGQVLTILELDHAVYEIEGVPTHEFFRRYADVDNHRLTDMDSDGFPEFSTVIGCECSPASAVHLAIDLGTDEAVTASVFVYGEELSDGSYKSYVPLIEPLTNPRGNQTKLQNLMIEQLLSTRFPATRNPDEAYPTDYSTTIQHGFVRSATAEEQKGDNLCYRYGYSSVSLPWDFTAETKQLGCSPKAVRDYYKNLSAQLLSDVSNRPFEVNLLEHQARLFLSASEMSRYFQVLDGLKGVEDEEYYGVYILVPIKYATLELMEAGDQLNEMLETVPMDKLIRDSYEAAKSCDVDRKPEWCGIASDMGLLELYKSW